MLLSLGIPIVLLVLLLLDFEDLRRTVATVWPELILWVALILLVNLIHYDVGSLQFTLDIPLLLAVSVLYRPSVAAAVAFVGYIDVREFLARVSTTRALYNRAQVSLSAFGAATVFHWTSGFVDLALRPIVGAAASLLVFFLLNATLVSAHVALRRGITMGEVYRTLRVGRPAEFAVTYLAYGILGLILAGLFSDVGAWTVALFLIPIAVAHMALVRAVRLQSLTDRLRNRENLLERLSQTIVDEREDERQRIATDLHDDLLQDLVRVSQLANFLRKEAPLSSRAQTDMEELAALSEATILRLRDVVGSLRRSPLGRGGLAPTLAGLAQDLQLRWRTSLLVDLPQRVDLPAEVQIVLYQVAKEAIINSLKHSGASTVRVALSETQDNVTLVVEDDGTGFEVDNADSSSHYGVGLMQERLRMIGGDLSIESSNQTGTKLQAVIPQTRQ
jgi:signal transduction histidine kinase